MTSRWSRSTRFFALTHGRNIRSFPRRLLDSMSNARISAKPWKDACDSAGDLSPAEYEAARRSMIETQLRRRGIRDAPGSRCDEFACRATNSFLPNSAIAPTKMPRCRSAKGRRFHSPTWLPP